MTVGIYGIFYMGECLYVGQSSDIEKRVRIHKNKLAKGTHIRKEFSLWFSENVKSTSLLDFVTLEECEDSDYTKNLLEIKWFDIHSPKFYGSEPTVNGKWKHSEETKSKIRDGVLNYLKNPLSYKLEEDRECKICEKPFKTVFASSVYCSEICRETGTKQSLVESHKKVKLQKDCNICGRGFTTNREEKESCESCLNKENYLSRKAICRWCNKVFYTVRKHKFYCSRKCGTLGFRRENPNYLPKSNKFGITKEELSYLYSDKDMIIDDIANHFGCKRQTVYNMLNKYSIPKKVHTKLNK